MARLFQQFCRYLFALHCYSSSSLAAKLISNILAPKQVLTFCSDHQKSIPALELNSCFSCDYHYDDDGGHGHDHDGDDDDYCYFDYCLD